MTSKKLLFFKSFGFFIALLGFCLNPTVVGKIISGDGNIERIDFLVLIMFFQIIVAVIGLFIFFSPQFLSQNWKKIISIIVGFLIAFTLVEVSADFFFDRPAFGWYGYPSGLYQADATKGFRFTPNFKGYFLNPPYDTIPININSHGLRDQEHEYVKPTGVTRILGLGDSVTFGPGVPVEETYLSYLEQFLKEKGTNIEVIKTGVNSYSFDQEYLYYLEEGYRYDSDIVVVGVLHKDIVSLSPKNISELYENTKRSLNEEQKKDNQNVIHKLRLWCRSCDVVYTFLNSFSNSLNKDRSPQTNWTSLWDNSENWEKYSTKILDLNNRLKGQGKRLVLVIFPYTEQFDDINRGEKVFQSRIIEFGKKENIPVLDLLPVLNVASYYRYYIGGDTVHLNKEGHRVVGETLAEFLVKSGILYREGVKK